LFHHLLSIVQARISVNYASVILTDLALFSCSCCLCLIHLWFYCLMAL